MGGPAYPLNPALSREGRGSKECPLPRRSLPSKLALASLQPGNACIRKRMQDGEKEQQA